MKIIGNTITATISDAPTLQADITSTQSPLQTSVMCTPSHLQADLQTVQIGGGGLPYEGQYEVTPSAYTTILKTKGLSMKENVVLNPIPSNYGLVTWNGAVLTVS